MATTETAVGQALADPVLESQQIFRRTLRAMSRPGHLARIAPPQSVPEPLNDASGALALTLFDDGTPVWLDAAATTDEVRDYLRFHCGCPLAERAGAAMFAIVAGPPPALEDFSTGSDEFPEESATVIIQVPRLSQNGETQSAEDLVLSGPGIKGTTALADAGLPRSLWDEWSAMAALYPRGLDLILTAGDSLCCLPRTVQVDMGRTGDAPQRS